MGGSNPYIDEVKYKVASRKFKVTFLPSGKTVEVDPEKFPYGHNGLPAAFSIFQKASRWALIMHVAGSAPARRVTSW